MKAMFRSCLILAIAAQLALAQSPDDTQNAKSVADLDEIDRTFNTRDWQSITPGQPARAWEDIRKFGFEGQNAPMQSAQILIDTFQLNGDTVVFTGRLGTVNLKGDVAGSGRFTRSSHRAIRRSNTGGVQSYTDAGGVGPRQSAAE
jgi:hypothetical protein